MDPASKLALVAACEAMDEAGLGDRKEHPRMGVIGATSRGPMRKWIEALQRKQAGKKMLPSLTAHGTVSCQSGVIAQEVGARGPSMTLSATCASAAAAIAYAAEQIMLGKADIMLAGGADCGTDPLVIEQMAAAGVLGHHASHAGLSCRPFHRDRNGMVLGDGAGFLVLESARSVRSRGATALGVLAGWGAATGAGGRTGIEDDGSSLARAMQEALATAGCPPHQIAYINAHGTGTRLNDSGEFAACRQVFKGLEHPVAISSTKPVTGHCLGATGALEAILTLRALATGVAPPTPGLDHPDDAFLAAGGLSLTRAQPAPITGIYAMSNASGFWSQHASLIFRST
jgi:3-oxoacyl-[acyl-carrier-protein] synthase II